MIFNHAIREFVEIENLDAVLKDSEETNKFRDQLEELLKREKI